MESAVERQLVWKLPRIEVVEHGSRPVLMTPARLSAPQGVRAIADIAYEVNAADYMVIAIDWDGTHLFGAGNEAAKPIIYIYAAKHFQNINRTAYIEIPLDIEEAFGQSNFSNLVATEIVQHIVEQFEIKAYESTHMKEMN